MFPSLFPICYILNQLFASPLITGRLLIADVREIRDVCVCVCASPCRHGSLLLMQALKLLPEDSNKSSTAGLLAS